MEINIPIGKDHKTTMGQRTEYTDPKIVLKEGQVINASVLAKANNQILLKVSDLFIRAEMEGKLTNTKSLQLKVESVLPDKITLKALETTQPSPKQTPHIPEMKIAFSLPEASQKQLSKINTLPAQTLAAKLVTGDNQKLMIKVNDQLLPVKPELVSFQGKSVTFQTSPDNKLYLIQNNKMIAQDFLGAQKMESLASEAGKNTQNHQLLKEMTRQEQVFIAQGSKESLVSDSRVQVVKLIVPEQSQIRQDSFTQQNIAAKSLPVEVKMVKNFFFNPDPKSNGLVQNNQARTGQELINLDRVTYNNKTELIEGFFKDNKLLFKPELEFKNNIPLFLKKETVNGKMVFQIDPQANRENQQLMQQLHLKLGQIIVEDENNVEIIKKIIDNKLPLTKENINTIQNFIQNSPVDAKTSIDFLINQNLLLGLFYQMNDNNDQFLLKGMQKKNKQNAKETDYEFTILYESEKLGNILIEILWSEKLAINFYCADQKTCDNIIATMEELKESIGLPDMILHAETNPEIIKKEPVSIEKITLSNVDFTV